MVTTDGWKTYKLGDIVRFRTGKLNSNAAVSDGTYPFFTCSKETFLTNTYGFDTEAVLLAGNNANGVYPIKYFKGKFDAYQRTYVIETIDEEILQNRFLFFAMQLKLSLLQTVSTGATTKFLTLTILKGLEVVIPPLPTQRRIAAILSAYDDLIENNTRRIAILEEMARRLYEEWFVHFRFPGHEDVPFIETDHGRLPEGWKIAPLGDLCKTSSGGTPSRKIEAYYGGDVQWVKTKELSNGPIYETEETITELGLTNSSAKIFPKHSVIIAMYGATIGQIGVLMNKASTNQACCALLPDSTGPGWEFLFLTLLNRKTDLIDLRAGAAQQNISQAIIKSFPILKPEDILLSRFRKVVSPLISHSFLLHSKNTNLRAQRDLLLPKLISGEIDVSEAEDTLETSAA